MGRTPHLRCPACGDHMMPRAAQHRCTNHQCEAELLVPLALDALPRADDGESDIRLLPSDVRHGLYLLTNLTRERLRESARRAGVGPTEHGRALKSLERKLRIFLEVLEKPETLDGLTDIEEKRLEIMDDVRSGRRTRDEGEVLLAQLADDAEQREQEEA